MNLQTCAQMLVVVVERASRLSAFTLLAAESRNKWLPVTGGQYNGLQLVSIIR